jgi:hypothetical protein
VPAISFAIAIALLCQGSIFALCVLALAGLLGAIRTRFREQVVAALWGRELTTELAGFWRIDRWLRPLWWGFHAICVFSAIGSRRITWAGVDYIVRSPQDIDVIRRANSLVPDEQSSLRQTPMAAAPTYEEQPGQP